jgi:hypothetical protein
MSSLESDQMAMGLIGEIDETMIKDDQDEILEEYGNTLMGLWVV